jgi:hypothetical protein
MRTKSFIRTGAIAILLMFAIPSIASVDPTNVSSRENKMDRIVTRSIDFPSVDQSELNEKAVVAVEFNVADDGRLVVKEINGNPSFVSYVKEKLENIVLKKMSDLAGKSFVYRFVFSK